VWEYLRPVADSINLLVFAWFGVTDSDVPGGPPVFQNWADESLMVVIVGGGMAGGNAAATLRDEGYDGPLLILADEPGVPFGRPPLSKTYLRGEEDLSGWFVRKPDWYREHQVELRTDDPVVRVDPASRSVTTRKGDVVLFDRLLIASGVRNRGLAVPGADLDGVFTLRTKADCDRIRAAVQPGDRVLLVGMGFIGSEVAASLTQMGIHVTAVFHGAAPLDRVLGDEVAAALAGIHREHGVELLAGDSVERLEGTTRIHAVTTTSGLRFECAAAILATGVQPNTEFLVKSGIAVDNGVLVDELCGTNVPGVFSCGDVANMAHPLFGRLRVEHYNNAEKHGAAAARSMLGKGAPYDYTFTFWSDQYDHTLEYVGIARGWDRFVVRGSLQARRFLGFYLKGGTMQAAVGLGRGGDPEADPDSEMAACGRLIESRTAVDISALSDEAVDLWELGGRGTHAAGE
jgi:3-phenylpropionate/trans-cinnamate dioxygenase ferredoxin reductase subunit